MPGGRHRKDSLKTSLKRQESGEAVNGNGHVANLVANGHSEDGDVPYANGASAEQRKPGCCSPLGCFLGENVDPDDPEDAVKVVCNNSDCDQGVFMHKDCFDQWEQEVLNFLRSCGRARSWSEKQRHQNLWSKRGYDLAFKACDCLCGRGHLQKDLNYVPLLKNSTDEDKKKRNRKKSGSKQLPAIGKPLATQNAVANAATKAPVVNADVAPLPNQQNGCGSYARAAARPRARTLSLGSVLLERSTSGTSPPVASPTSPHSFGDVMRKASGQSPKWEEFIGEQTLVHGSIFARRANLSGLTKVLPRWKVNGFHIKMEDDCPQGNDDTRCFLLTRLGDHKMTEISCLFCRTRLMVYDRYPLLDGTFFLSPNNHADIGIAIKWDGHSRFLLALCVGCLETSADRLSCVHCGAKGWFQGDSLVLGTLYTYDVLAAFRCCEPHCEQCKHPLPNALPFSGFSEVQICSKCGARGYHLLRRLSELQLVA